MEALAAIGLASNVLSFVETTAKLASLIKEYSSVGEAPAEVLAISKRLDLTMKVVKGLDESGRARLDHEEHALQIYCREAESLRIFLESLKLSTQQPRGSRAGGSFSWLKNVKVEKGWKAFRALRGKEKIDTFQSSLDRVLDLIRLQQQMRIEATALRVEDRTTILLQNSESIIRGLRELQLNPDQGLVDAASMQRKVIFMVPLARNSGFLGRDEIILQLEEKLTSMQGQSESKEVQTAALYGLGGIGKSQIALEYAYLCKERSPDTSVFWILASTATRFEESFKQIAAAFRLPGRNAPHADVLQLVRNWLERDYNQPWMMVVDNVDNNEIFQKMQSGKSPLVYLPKIGDGAIIFTSRNRDVSLNLVDDPIVVESLSRNNARTLLGDRTKGISTDEEKDALLAELDHLPLAITQAASYMAKRGKTVSQYLELFQDSERSRVKLLEHKFVDAGREARALESVATTWLMSFEQIRSENHRAANLLFTMSLMNRQSIPSSLIKAEDENIVDFEEVVGMLAAYSFVSVDDSGSNYSMHRLVQTVTRAWLDDHGDRAFIRTQALGLVSNRFPNGEFETWESCTRYLPHAQSVLLHTSESLFDTDRIVCSDLHTNLAWYFKEQGKYSPARTNMERALGMLSSMQSCEPEKIWRAKRKLATIIERQGYPEQAIELLREVLEAEDALYLPDHLETLETVNELALALANTLLPARWLESEKLARRSLEGRRSALEGGDIKLLESLHSLGWVLYRQGKFDESVSLLSECLQKRQAVLGEQNPKTVSTTNDLAMALINLDPPQFQKAEHLLRTSADLIISSCGIDHPNCTIIQINLCNVLKRSGKHTEAQALQLEQLMVSEKTFGPNHPTTIWCIVSIAESCFSLKKYNEAESFIFEELNKRPDLIRQDIISALILINYLGLICEEHQDFTEAAKNFQTVFQGRKEELGADHPATLQAEHCLARVILAQGRAVEAAELLRALMPREARVLGAQHEQTVSTLRLHGLAFFNQRKFSEAEQLFRQVLNMRENILGKEHESTLIARNNLEAALGEQRKWSEWEEFSRESLAIRQRVGPDDYHTLRVKSNLWFASEQQGKAIESDAIFNDLLGIIKALPANFMESESFKNNVSCEEEWYFWRLRNGSFDLQTLRARKRMADWIQMKPSAAVSVGGTGTTGAGMASMFSSFVKTDSQESADELAAEIYREVIKNMEKTCGRDSEEVRAVNEDYAMLLQQQRKTCEAARVLKHSPELGI